MELSFASRMTLLLSFLALLTSLPGAAARTRYYEFNIGHMNVTKLCRTKTIVAVNGQFPGPAIRIKQGDHVVVKVNNLVDSNITIHWHGVKQMLTAWQDGPAYITQCPIQRNGSFTYRFKVDQVGTLIWHAHISWLRGTVYGSFVVKPRRRYPFPVPDREETVLLGDWFIPDLEEEEQRSIRVGKGVPKSDAYVFNGKPGPLYNCSAEDTHIIKFVPGKTHLLRIINAAVEQDLFFSIANHSMTVVEIDASYTKPLTVSQFMITPGQTVSVLVRANQKAGRYYMAASPWRSSNATFNPTASLAIIEYITPANNLSSSRPVLHALPSSNDENSAEAFQRMVRSLNSKEHPEEVPQKADRKLFVVVGFNVKPCSPGINCTGPQGFRVTSSMNNVSFVGPSTTSIMEAYYNKVPGIYTTDFPDNPPVPYDYTGETLPISQLQAVHGTKVSVIPYGSNVQLVLQTPLNTIGNATHPFHLHGFDFYIVGEGKGTFNATRDEPNFNLVDPPRRNTALMPMAGWVALRFKADNPGAWLFHCHLDGHVTFGMEMVFLVENGKGPKQTLPPPPKDLPKC